MKIFIVDDASFIRIICRYHLDKAGYEIVGESHDGEEAVKAIQTLQPDCVITDLALPNRNGVSLIQEIQSKFPQIQFIVMTALDKDMFLRNGQDVKISGFLTKPFEAHDLLEKVKRAESLLRKKSHG